MTARSFDERAALGSALGAVLLWSTVATGFKLGLRDLEPVQLLLLGTLTSALLFAALATVSGQWRAPHARPGWLLACALLGLVNPLCYYLMLFEAYDRLPAQIAQPLNYTWAITLALLSVPVLGQRLTRHTAAGLLVGYAGVVILLSQGRLDGWATLDWGGVALALTSTLLWAGYWLAQARSTLPPVTLMAWSFAFATPAVALAAWLGPGWPAPSWPNVGYGAWVGLVEMGVTFLLWQNALRRTANAARIGALIYLAPLLSLVLIDTVLGEPVHPSTVIALLVILGGLALTRRSQGDPG